MIALYRLSVITSASARIMAAFRNSLTSVLVILAMRAFAALLSFIQSRIRLNHGAGVEHDLDHARLIVSRVNGGVVGCDRADGGSGAV